MGIFWESLVDLLGILPGLFGDSFRIIRGSFKELLVISSGSPGDPLWNLNTLGILKGLFGDPPGILWRSSRDPLGIVCTFGDRLGILYRSFAGSFGYPLA